LIWVKQFQKTECRFIFHTCRGTHFQEFLDLMAQLKRGECDGVKTRLGRLQVLSITVYAGSNFQFKHRMVKRKTFAVAIV
jgi:hypothetical protein